ncbi:hypothetical protein MMC25_003018 [Agyrium rufum]|nr:hypothetical protein [Agyrium rufum]
MLTTRASLVSTLLSLAALLSTQNGLFASAQTFTACNPLNSTNCPTDPAFGMNYTFDFTDKKYDSVWNTTAGTIIYDDNAGAEFTIKQRGDAPEIQSTFYIFFGEVEVWLKAAMGQGVVSSIVLQSDDLDEVDWELIGGNDSYVETNYFGKGNTTSFDRAVWYPVEKPQENFHNYTTRWTSESIEWFVDGALVRTLNASEANHGKNFPQTPMNVRVGIWAGGDEANNNGTIEWAGGLTDYDKGPYTMYVSSVRVTDFSTGAEYKYGDKTGSWESIQITNGTSQAATALASSSKGTIQTATQRFNAYPTSTKIAIFASAGGALALVLVLITWCCVRQRRAGRREREIADAEWEKAHAEVLSHRAMQGQQGQGQAQMGQMGPGVGYRGIQSSVAFVGKGSGNGGGGPQDYYGQGSGGMKGYVSVQEREVGRRF